MRTIKIFVIVFLAVLTFTGTAHASSYADETILNLLHRQIIDKIPENPNDNITREDFCVILSKAVLIRENSADNLSGVLTSFVDADLIHIENYPNIAHLYDKGILRGVPSDGKMYIQPNSLISRQDAAVMLGRWLGLDPEADSGVIPHFSDSDIISDYAHNIIAQLYDMNVISGYPDGTFKPLNSLNFAEVSVLVYKALEYGQSLVVTYFGSGIIGNSDGADFETRFAMPSGICFDNSGNLTVFDTYNAGIKIIKDNKSETILGFSRVLDDYGFTKPFYVDASRESALLGRPTSGVYGSNNDLYFTDSENNAIRLLRDDTVYTFAGGTQGFADGKPGESKFNYPTDIAVDDNGVLYVADTHNHCIRKILPNGLVQTIAGTPEKPGFLDGDADEALFYEPSGIELGENGVIYVSDTGNHVIRKIDGGVVTTIAGVVTNAPEGDDYSPGGYEDGTALSASFCFPTGLCYTGGVLYIADTGNHSVRALSGGNVSTVAGNGNAGDADGLPNLSMMNKPMSLAYSNGVLYIADSFNNKIKMLNIGF